jgi:integrase
MAVTPYTTKAGRRWRVRLYDPLTGHMTSVSAGHRTKREARAAEADAIANGRGPERSVLTVAGWRETWLETHPMKSSTRAHNRERTAAFAKTHGDMLMVDVDRKLARAWRKAHPSTTMALSAMWTAAAKHEDLPVGQPWAGMASNGRRDIQAGWLTLAQIEDLRAHARDAWPGPFGLVADAAIVVLAYTGIRPGELAALRWENLRPDDARVDIVAQLDSKTKALTTPKSGVARTVVYPAPAQRAVATMPRLHDAWVFTGPAGGLLTSGTRNRIWHPIRVAFGRPTMDLYELRHFCATRLVELGMTSSDVAIQLGHRDGGRLVESTYGHARPDPALARVARTLADADAPTTPAEEATA